MKIKSLFDHLVENWPAKIICFTLALLLFLFHQMSTLENKYLSVPLRIYAEGELVPASSYPRVVRVSLRGKPENISSVTENDVTAFVDFSYYTEPGFQTVPVQIQLSSSAMSVNPLEVQVEPQQITVNLEDRITAFVPITPSFTGELAKGYRIADYSSNPAMVEISGPRSIVEKIDEMFSDSISIEGKNASFTATAAVLNRNMLVSLQGNTVATFTVTVAPKIITRIFANVPVHFNSLQTGLKIAGQETPLTVELEGPQNELEIYTFPSYAAQADCSQITGPGTYSVPVVLYLPDQFTVRKSEPSDITITVEDNGTP